MEPDLFSIHKNYLRCLFKRQFPGPCPRSARAEHLVWGSGESALWQALPLMFADSKGGESLTCSSLRPVVGKPQPQPTKFLNYLVLTKPHQAGIGITVLQIEMLKYIKLSGFGQGHTARERPSWGLDPASASLAVKLLISIPISPSPALDPLCPQPSLLSNSAGAPARVALCALPMDTLFSSWFIKVHMCPDVPLTKRLEACPVSASRNRE